MRLHYPALLRVNMCRPELHILTSETTQIPK